MDNNSPKGSHWPEENMNSSMFSQSKEPVSINYGASPIVNTYNSTDQRKVNFSITLPQPSNDKLQELILYKNVFSAEECRKIIASSSTTDKDQASIGYGRLNLDIRNTLVRFFRFSEDFLWIGEKLTAQVVKANNNNYGFNISHISDLQILEYREGCYFDWHTDLGPAQSSTRKLSVILFLSAPEDYEGGKISWCPYENIEITQEQGSMVIFPSYMPHKVEKVTKGVRYSLVCWVHGPPFN